ncbi:MAG: protein kinase, partial [Planctomycetaceae bacterium]
MSTACPNVIVLTRFASGALDEQIALGVSQHLETCKTCQRRTDELARETDSLVLAVRAGEAGPAGVQRSTRATGPAAADRKRGPTRDTLTGTTHADQTDETYPEPDAGPRKNAQLDRLIADAQAIAPQLPGRPASLRQASPSTDLNRFVSALRRSGLLDESRVDGLVQDSEAVEATTFSQQLVDRKILTPYQSRVLSRGRWKGLVLGNYEILEKLGQGGMGQVYRAKHRRMGRIVCLKVLRTSGRRSPEMVERFRREIKAVSSLDHPNFVIAHDADEAAGIQFLVMEYVEGHDLSKLVLDGGPLARQDALEIIRQTADALDHAHDQGVIHRDIKPQNLMLTPDEYGDSAGHLKVLDLGIARLDSVSGSEDGTTRATMTTTGAIVGTVDYMSPEQALNSRRADARSDIYSLGCTLYFLLTGKTLHAGETIMERLVAHRELPAPRLCDLLETADPDLEAVYRKMVLRDPEKRYQTMAELLEDLDAMLSGRRPQARNPVWPTWFRLPTRFRLPQRYQTAIPVFRRRGAAVAAGICLLVLAAVMIWPGDGSQERPGQTRDASGQYAGSDSRADRPLLVVLPSGGFKEEDLNEVKIWFQKKGIPYQPASSKTGQLKSISQQCRLEVKTKISDYSPAEYSGLVFVGGHVQEYKPQGTHAKIVH